MKSKRKNIVYSHIRRTAFFNMIIPVIILIVAIIILYKLPFNEILDPKSLKSIDDIEDSYIKNQEYVEIKIKKAIYTGYDMYTNGKRYGSYYYCMSGDKCYILVLKNQSGSLPEEIDNYTITARLVENSDFTRTVMKKIAKKIDWNYEGLSAITSYITVDNTAYHSDVYFRLLLILLFTIIVAISFMVVNIVIYILPGLHPACVNFRRLETRKGKGIAHVNYELNSRLILESGNLKLTENYLFSYSNFNVEIVPINSIIWAFEHSNLHGIVWFRTRITYTLHILCKHGLTISSPKNTDEHVKIVLDYLRDNYPDILIGHTDENKKEARKRRHHHG